MIQLRRKSRRDREEKKNLLEEDNDVGKTKQIFRILTTLSVTVTKAIRVCKLNQALKNIWYNSVDAIKILIANEGDLKKTLKTLKVPMLVLI